MQGLSRMVLDGKSCRAELRQHFYTSGRSTLAIRWYRSCFTIGIRMNQLLHTLSRESQEEPVLDTANPEPFNPSWSTAKVLLAEDEPVVRELMASVLREMGCTVLEAGNGEQALRILERSSGQGIDLLLTDIVMPVMGGRELAYKIGSLFPKAKILFCSAYPEKLGIRNGMFDKQIPFLQKPVTTTALKLKMREIMGDAQEDLQQGSAVTEQN